MRRGVLGEGFALEISGAGWLAGAETEGARWGVLLFPECYGL